METDSLSTLLLLLVLLCFSAFFSACEMALSSVNKMRIKTMAEDGDRRARTVLTLSDRFERTLSCILVGNNVVNIAAASSATVLATHLFGVSGVAIATAAMTVFILIFGEVLPKSIAKENAEQVSLALGGTLALFIYILTPVSFLFIKLQEVINRLCSSEAAQPLVTAQELRNIIETIEEEGVIDEQKSELMQSALNFDDTTVQEVLTPRVDMVALNLDDDPEKIRQTILTERFSRIPVFERSLDNIIGILQTRDYLEAALSGESPVALEPLLAKPLFVHKTQRISSLLNDFKRERMHMAVVIDDFGGTMGIVSLEDLLEELVGDIWDEDEEAEEDFVQLEPFVYRFSGDFPIDDALERIGYEEREFESEYSTVGGWAFERLGAVPTVGMTFSYNGIEAHIDEMDDQRVVWLTLRYLPPEPQD